MLFSNRPWANRGKFLFLYLALLVSQTTQANNLDIFYQPDGTSFRANYHKVNSNIYLETSTGYILVQDPKTRIWNYATFVKIFETPYLSPSGVPYTYPETSPYASFANRKMNISPQDLSEAMTKP